MAEQVCIVEVGPRDGLQNEPRPVATRDKLAFIAGLTAAGLREIEVTSFVSPKRVPQLADAAEVMAGLERAAGVRYSALVPNRQGLERAANAGVQRIAVFTAASETFTQRNIGMTIEESLKEFGEVIAAARKGGMSCRGYVSTAFVCPYEGAISPGAVRRIGERLMELGVDEISVGDTIGAAVPSEVDAVVGELTKGISIGAIALHFHDTYGTAVANVAAGLRAGVRRFDASAGGLGGCPFAPGASGNLATEDAVYLLDRMGYETGVDLARVAEASFAMERVLGRPSPSRQVQRLRAARGPGG